MKKVVLLAGALAAGMAAAPVTANAAAPMSPEVNNLTTGDSPYQDYEHYYNVLAARHTALELMKQDVQDAIANPSTAKETYKGMSAESLALILADIQDQINELDGLQFAVKSLYDAMTPTEQQDQSYSTTEWEKAVDDAIGYITTKVTADQFDKLLDTYKEFDKQHQIWEEYNKWYYGNDHVVKADGTDTGFSDKFATYQTTEAYKHVDEISDVNTKVTTIQTNQTAFEALLVEPALDSDTHSIVNGIDETLSGNLATAKDGLVADFNQDSAKPGVLNKLVGDYHSEQTKFLGTDEGMYGAIETSMTAKMADSANDLTKGEFLLDPADPASYSHKYATALATKLLEFAAAVQATKDFIDTFAANDPSATGWKTTFSGEGNGKTGAYDAIAKLDEYRAKGLALLATLAQLETDYDNIIEAAKKNVEAAKQLVAAEGTRQSEMDGAFLDATKTTKANGTTLVSYRDRNKEEVTFTGLASTVKDGTPYIYRSYIDALQAKLNDANTDYDGTDAVDTDIHDQILKYFDDPASADNDHDAVSYKATMTDAEGVLLGEIKGEIETLANAIEANESANVTLHALEAALDKHVLDMVATCRDYDDVTSADLTYGGKYYTDGTCEDNRNYHGVETLRKTDIGNFKKDEVDAYNSFDPADATKGAAAFLGDDTNSPAKVKRYAIDDEIELLWNHIATDQLNKYLKDVEDKMVAKFNDAKALDKVCRDAADVWDWTVVPDTDEECKCEPNDTKENPCGWCTPTVKAALNAIRKDYNDNSEAKETAHAGNGSTDVVDYVDATTEYPGVGTAKSLVADFKTYAEDATKAGGDIETWYNAFVDADKAHDDNLQDLKDEATQYVHEYIHEAVGNMSHDLANFVDGDLAAADLWAQDLQNRTFPVYSSKGEAPAEEKLDLDLNGTPDTFANFEAYVDAVRDADAIYTAKIDELFKAHKWTELRKLTDKAKDVHPATDYMKAVEANRTAKAALLAKVEDIRSDIEEAKNEVACEDPACKTDIAAMFTELEQKLTNAEIAVNSAFNAGDATTATATVGELAPAFGLVKKQIDDLNTQVRLSKTAALDMTRMVEKAFDKTNGTQIVEAQVEGYENFKVRNTDPEAITNEEVSYFDEIETMVQKLKDMIAKDDSHEGGHVAATSTAKYLEEMSKIQKELDKLVQAIKDNEQAHKDQLKHRDELYKKYECYDTTGLEAAVNGIADPDFSLDTEFPEVPGYPETAVDPAGKDHTKAHTAVAEAIKALDAEIKKHYENGASNVEAAKTKIGEKETAYTTAFTHAQTNDSKFMEEYGKCTEAAKAVKYTYENWKADHFANGANKYSDEANVQVTKAYNEMVAAQKAYLKDIKTDWYNNEAVEKVANNETLLNTYKEKINAYNAAVEKAQKNDQEFDKQLAAHVVKPLTAEATYTDTRVVADPVYVTLKAQLTALYPECNNVETDSKYNTIRKQIIQDWEDEKSALNGTAAAVAAYQAAAKKYNELMANLNAYGSQLVKYLQQKDAFDSAKSTIAGYDIMKPGYKDFDGNTEGAEDYNHKKDIENAISNINGKLNTLYGDMKTEATHVAETINDTNPANNEVNDLNVAPAVGTIKTLIENLVKDAKAWEDACDANEAAFEPLHDNIKTVEADYAEGSAKVTALPEPAQEAFILAVKEDLEALAELQKDLEEAYMAENAVNFTKDNTDYEDLKKEIEEMYARAEEAGAHLGDIDFNGEVTVYDSDALVDIVLYNRGYAVRGDFDFNGENDVTDVERLNNLLWYEHILKAWAPGRVAFEGDIELTAEGNTVALALNNNVKTNGIQFDITVPEGAYIQNVLGTDRVEGMRVLTACIADNTYRVLVISTLNASTINDNEGNIVTFNVCGGNEVEVSNVIATDGNSHRLNGAAVSVGVATNIEEIATEGETEIFGLSGIRQSVMQTGVNIVRGANGLVKKIFNK